MQHPWNGSFCEVFGPLLSQIWSNISEIFTKGSTLAKNDIVRKKFEGLEFSWKREGPKGCTFGPILTTHFPLKMAEIEKKKLLVGKNVSHWAIQICQNKVSISSPLTSKNKFGCFSWYHAYIFKKNELVYLMQNLMLNQLAPTSNPKNQKVKSSHVFL